MNAKKRYSISAVIIARNEAATIAKVLDESIETLPKLTKEFEILVNDDASSDITANILDAYKKKYPRIKVFHQKKALGIAGGFEFLYSQAKYDLIFTNSADGQYTIYELPKMLKKIYEGFDLVIGKRKQKNQYNILRKISSYCFAVFPKVLFGTELYDPGSCKLYKKEFLKKTKPISKSVFNEAERIIRGYKEGYKITSIPVRYFARKKGRSTVGLNLIYASFKDMFKLYFDLKF